MNPENVQSIIEEIKQLQSKNINLDEDLNIDKIKSDFEYIQERSKYGSYTLSKEYQIIKLLQQSLRRSLALVEEDQISEFISLARAIEKIRLLLSEQYETKKIVSMRARHLRELLGNSEA